MPVQPELPHSEPAPAQPHVPKAGECHPPAAHLPLPAAHLFVCLHTPATGIRCRLCLFAVFAGQQILLQLLKKGAAGRVREQQCKLQGKAEELRSPALARISKLASHSILTCLVFLQNALIFDIYEGI